MNRQGHRMDRNPLWECFPAIPHDDQVPTQLSLENYEDLGWQEPLLYKPASLWESYCDEDSSCSLFNELPTSDTLSHGLFETDDFFGLLGTNEFPTPAPIPQRQQRNSSSIRKSRSGDAAQVKPKRRKQSFNEKFDEELFPQESGSERSATTKTKEAKRQPFRARLDSDTWGKAKDRLLLKRDKHVRRAKWTPPEVFKLWKAISKYGNNWVQIEHCLSDESRTYEQVKDKGRRILFQQGWRTGRKKQKATEAMDSAKEIASKQIRDRNNPALKHLFRKRQARPVKIDLRVLT